MRYLVQLWLMNEWQTQDSANTARMAALLAGCIQKQWGHLGARVRVFDADEQRPIAVEEVS